MTATLSRAPATFPARPAERPGVRTVAGVELRKLAAQTAARVVALACVLAPVAFAAVLSVQTAVPADTLFGLWVHTSGFASPLVVLGFAGAWGFPVLIGLVAGDIFAAEDRHGTWDTLLTRSCSRGALFVGKTLAAAAYSLLMLVLLAASSIAAGVIVIGAQPLVGLSGGLLPPGQALGLVLASWATAVIPVIGLTSVGLLFSVLTRNGIVAILSTAVVGLLMQLLSLVGGSEIGRALLLTTPLDAWHGLLVARPFYRPLEQGAIVTAAYTAASLSIAWAVFRRRSFTAAQGSQQRGWATPLRRVVISAAVVVLLAFAASKGPTRLTAGRLEESIGPTFGSLVVVQQKVLGRAVPAGATLRVLPVCNRRGVRTTRRGPGDNWICTLAVLGPNITQKPFAYEVTLKTNGCYTADAQSTLIGPATIRDAHHRTAVNPLYRFDGCFDTSAAWP